MRFFGEGDLSVRSEYVRDRHPQVGHEGPHSAQRSRRSDLRLRRGRREPETTRWIAPSMLKEL